MGHHRGYAENFFSCRKEKILVDYIVFEFQNFSYIKAFSNNIVSSTEIKPTYEVTKNVLVYVAIHLLEILYRK